jgi:amino acid transporter
MVAVDAGIVLCGGVLTSYVGVIGLMERMTNDRYFFLKFFKIFSSCFPSFLLKKNPWTKTPHFIILGFFLMSALLFVSVSGDLNIMGGVFTLAFLSVMFSFAFGNMLVKYKRPGIFREYKTRWPTIFFATGAISVGIVGNILLNVDYLKYFILVLALPVVLATFTFSRIKILKLFLFFANLLPNFLQTRLEISQKITEKLKGVAAFTVVFFTKTAEIHILNKAVLYAHQNELCNSIVLVHVYESENFIPQHLKENHYIIDHVYPKIKIDLVKKDWIFIDGFWNSCW